MSHDPGDEHRDSKRRVPMLNNSFLRHLDSCPFCRSADIWNAIEVELCLDGMRLMRELAEEHAKRMEAK